MKLLVEYATSFLGVGLLARIALFWYSRQPQTAETILANMRPCDVVHSLEISRSLTSWRKIAENLMGERSRTAYMLDTLHNARSLLSLVSKLDDADPDDLRYIMDRVWGIWACLPLSLMEDAFRYVYAGLPIFTPLVAASAYGELWFRAKAVLYDTRPELVGTLEGIS